MIEELVKQLWFASEGRKVCRINLKGEPFPRVIHPFGVCQNTHKKIILVCEQVAGFTKGGGGSGYRNLILSKVKEIEVLSETFSFPSDFNPLDTQYSEWVFHI